MTLSEAMRKGAAMRPQARGKYFAGGATCALGAAMEGVGVPVSTLMDERCLVQLWMHELRRRTRCPKCDDLERSLGLTVVHLNDDHHEPRERIADWLEGMGL